MPVLDDQAREDAQANSYARALPVGVANWTALSTSTTFPAEGVFPKGSWVTIALSGAAHVNVNGAATTSHPQLPAGVHHFVMPVEGDVRLLQASSASGSVWQS